MFDDTLRGILVGTAVGDAWGVPTEFMHFWAIDAKYPNGVPFEGMVSDDTQMSIALVRAVGYAADDEDLRTAVARQFVAWRDDPRNVRAPGMACMKSTAALKKMLADGKQPADLLEAGQRASKGCGTIMRVAPLGMVTDQTLRRQLAGMQAVLTHGHPVAIAGAMIVADLAYALAEDAVSPVGALDAAILLADDLSKYILPDHAEWLGNHQFIDGAIEIGELLREMARAEYDGLPKDVSSVAPRAGTAEAVLASALLCMRANDDPIEALRCAVVSGGDSDSIAAVVGGLLGAWHGPSVFSELWPQVEADYRAEIDELAPAVD